MGKIFDKLSGAIANLKKTNPGIATSLQGITANLDNLENQIQQMQAQKPTVQTQLQAAAGTVQSLKTQVQALLTALQSGSSAGYVLGLYVGANALLSGQQLHDLPFEHYWQSCSEVPSIPARGHQMVQTLVGEPVNGIGIDQDTT
jgi:hypothetical protein